MQNVIAGLVISLLTEAAKKIDAIPLTDGQKVKIRLVVVGLSFVGSLGIAFLNGGLASSSILPIIGNTIANFIFATISYYGVIK